jgi:hypothetical protein
MKGDLLSSHCWGKRFVCLRENLKQRGILLAPFT